MTSTLAHYNSSAHRYFEANHALPTAERDRRFFLARLLARTDLPDNRRLRLLDAGSGTGRDTLAFVEEGFEVDAFDGSEAMAALSTRLTGQATQVMRFEALDLPHDYYDAVWAMASLLHVPRELLPQVLVHLANAMTEGGMLFASFKEGTGERVDPRDGRAFTDLDAEGTTQLLEEIEGLDLVITASRMPPEGHTSQEPWFCCILRKAAPRVALKAAARP